jgi:HTH-type transcriptional regulator / antitoxin HipB
MDRCRLQKSRAGSVSAQMQREPASCGCEAAAEFGCEFFPNVVEVGSGEYLQRAPPSAGLQPEMRELQLDALRGTLGDLEAELADYNSLHDATLIEATGIAQLPTALIRARIACGLTQRQLAERVGLQEQAIQRYESSDYATVNFARLVDIAMRAPNACGARSNNCVTAPCHTDRCRVVAVGESVVARFPQV